MFVRIKNDIGIDREVKVGFAWTSLFFGGFPFFFRGMPVHGISWILLSIITIGISNLILPFIINKQTVIYYLEHGYKPVGSNWDVAASAWGISLPPEENVVLTTSTENDVKQSTIAATEAVTKSVKSPLPLLLIGGVAVFSSMLTQFLALDFISYIVASSMFLLLGILNLIFFIWAANQYLEKKADKVFAISLMVSSHIISIVFTMLSN